MIPKGDFKDAYVDFGFNRLIHLNESVFGSMKKQTSSGNGGLYIAGSRLNLQSI